MTDAGPRGRRSAVAPRSRVLSPSSAVARAAAALVAVLLWLSATLPATAQDTPLEYVALGDSYSSGTGTRSYLDDGTLCQRSVHAYPSLLASARGWTLRFRACAGATVPVVAALQLGALSDSTAYVTLSVGGNDAGFAAVLTTCALPRWAAHCRGAVTIAQAYITTVLPRTLAALYGEIRARAPAARVVVVGYPRIFNGTDCNAGTWFSPTEMTRLNATADLLNATTSAVAAAAGFSFVNPTRRFLGHAVCDDPEWINGLSSPVIESYHPNRAGHRRGYLPRVARQLTGSSAG